MAETSPLPQAATQAVDKPWNASSQWLYDALASRFAEYAGDYQTAIQQIASVAEESRQYDAFKYSFDLTIDALQLKKAEIIAADWVAQFPNDERAQLSLIRAFLMEDNHQAAYLSMLKMLQHNHDPSVVSQLSAMLSYLQNDDERLEMLTNLANHFPNDPYIYYYLGLMAKEQGRVSLAITAFSTALRVAPNWRELETMQASVLASVGRVNEAKRMMDKLRARYPKDQTLLSAEIDMLVDHYQWQEALTLAKQWQALAPEDVQVTQLMAWLYGNAGELEQARIYYQRLVKLQQLDNDQYAFQMAQAAQAAKKYPLALAYLQKISPKSNLDMLARQQIALIAFKQKDIKTAMADFAALRKKYASYALEMYLVEISQLDKLGAHAEAEQRLQQALREYPTQVDALYALAEHQTQINDVAGAKATYANILQIDPANIDAINALGYLLLTKTQEMARAQQLISAALEKYPSSPAIQDSYGWMLFLQGKPQQALRWLQRAFSAYRKGEIAAHYVVILNANGERALAQEVYDSERIGQPDNKYLQKVGVQLGLDKK